MRIQVDIYIRMKCTNENADGRGGWAYEQGYLYIARHRDIGVHQICRKRRKKTKRWL